MKICPRNFELFLNLYKKSIKNCTNWKLDLMQTNLLNYFLILHQILHLCDRFQSFIFADIFIIFCLQSLNYNLGFLSGLFVDYFAVLLAFWKLICVWKFWFVLNYLKLVACCFIILFMVNCCGGFFTELLIVWCSSCRHFFILFHSSLKKIVL